MTKAKKSPRAKSKPKSARSPAIVLPALSKGERYAGILLDDDGAPNAHLILLQGELEASSWQESGSWAKKQGGALPTRQEQALLFANLKKHFQQAWYWSGTPSADDESYAWFQDFSYGNQLYDHKDYKLRAVAVRRVSI